MSVSQFTQWRRDGCNAACRPRQHDPDSHEVYGYRLATERTAVTLLEIGSLHIDLVLKSVKVGGVYLPLSEREWELLAYLARNVDRWCKPAEIEQSIWGTVYQDEPGHLTRVMLHRLRNKLGSARSAIWTRNQYGYLLRSDPNESPPPVLLERARGTSRTDGRWAIRHDACVACHGTAKPHHSRGLCNVCMARQRRRQARTGVFV